MAVRSKNLALFGALLFLSLGFAPAFAADGDAKLEEIESRTIPSTYLNLNLKTYRYNFDTMGGDGAIARSGDDILLGTREGRFFLIKQDMSVQNAPLPPVELGLDAFQKSKRFGYFEKTPRLHALLINKDTTYATFDFFDQKADSIRYVLAAIKKNEKEWKVLFASPPLDIAYYSMGGGGRMAMMNGDLYFSVGDYSMDRKNKLPSDFASQNAKLPFGKINRLDLQTLKVSPYTIGNRNALGLTVDNGTLVATDNGPRGGDGLYLLKEGENYGWPYSNYGRNYGDFKNINHEESPCTGKQPSGVCTNYAQPAFVFLPSVAPTQIIKLKGFAADWDNDFLMGSLKAQTIYRIHMLNGRVLYVEPIVAAQRIRDMVQIDGKIWILDDSGLIQILSVDPSPKLHEEKLMLACLTCHTMNPDPTSPTPYAPNLFGVVGRQAGRSNFSGYSVGMKETAPSIGKWNHDSLTAFLQNPAAVVPGTSMPHMAESFSDENIKDIVDQLQALPPILDKAAKH